MTPHLARTCALRLAFSSSSLFTMALRNSTFDLATTISDKTIIGIDACKVHLYSQFAMAKNRLDEGWCDQLMKKHEAMESFCTN